MSCLPSGEVKRVSSALWQSVKYALYRLLRSNFRRSLRSLLLLFRDFFLLFGVTVTVVVVVVVVVVVAIMSVDVCRDRLHVQHKNKDDHKQAATFDFAVTLKVSLGLASSVISGACFFDRTSSNSSSCVSRLCDKSFMLSLIRPTRIDTVSWSSTQFLLYSSRFFKQTIIEIIEHRKKTLSCSFASACLHRFGAVCGSNATQS